MSWQKYELTSTRTTWFVSDLVGNPKDSISYDEAHMACGIEYRVEWALSGKCKF